jgi:hypothetical protein
MSLLSEKEEEEEEVVDKRRFLVAVTERVMCLLHNATCRLHGVNSQINQVGAPTGGRSVMDFNKVRWEGGSKSDSRPRRLLFSRPKAKTDEKKVSPLRA